MTKREIDKARARINAHFTDYAKNPSYANPQLEDIDSCALLRKYL